MTTNLGIFFFFYYFITIFLSLMTCIASSKVVLVGHNNATLCFGIETNFTPPVVEESGEGGVLYMAQPHDACSTLTNNVELVEGASPPPFVLIARGGVCSFEDKVRRAQAAGYKAAIVYDDEDGGVLVAMEGNSAGVRIHAVFVSKASGKKLIKYAGHTDMELWIIPTFEENSVGYIFAIIFIFLLGMSSFLATCFFVKRFQYIRADQQHRISRFRKFHGMSSVLVKAMPSQIFTTADLKNNCTSETCAICLENYVVGEELRILPCLHKFHAFCVDSWLTTRRTLCPLCKRDARPTPFGDLPSSETTPLLSSSSPASSSVVS